MYDNLQSSRYSSSFLFFGFGLTITVQDKCIYISGNTVLQQRFSLIISHLLSTPTNLVKNIRIIDLGLKRKTSPNLVSANHLLVSEPSIEFFSNQWMLPVWDGTRDPEICNISSSKLQDWIKSLVTLSWYLNYWRWKTRISKY